MKPVLATLFFASASVALFFIFVLLHVFLPAPHTPEIVELKVEPGEPFSAVVRRLREQDVIPNELLFSLWARISGVERKIHWGLYRFELPLAPREVLNRMDLGKGLFHKVTIPEGLTVKEIAQLLADSEIVDQERFLDEAAGPDLLAALGLAGKGARYHHGDGGSVSAGL